MEDFFTVIYIAMGLIMLVGGRTSLKVFPNILTMILIEPHCTLWVLFFTCGKNIVTTMVWHFLCSWLLFVIT
jgi:hypothetical protein